ncbi:hypothetical protein ACWDPC_37020, partial [Streptomyces misionensis]
MSEARPAPLSSPPAAPSPPDRPAGAPPPSRAAVRAGGGSAAALLPLTPLDADAAGFDALKDRERAEEALIRLEHGRP